MYKSMNGEQAARRSFESLVMERRNLQPSSPIRYFAKSHRTPAKKRLIFSTHSYFLPEARDRLDPLKRSVRHRVADCFGVPAVVVARVDAEWKRHGDSSFERSSERAPSTQSVVKKYGNLIMQIIEDRNIFSCRPRQKAYKKRQVK